jgi:hypothetical protein
MKCYCVDANGLICERCGQIADRTHQLLVVMVQRMQRGFAHQNSKLGNEISYRYSYHLNTDSEYKLQSKTKIFIFLVRVDVL